MENKTLDAIWDQQPSIIPPFQSQEIIKKAVAQRRNQIIGIVVMCITVGILVLYAIWQFPDQINMFITGLFVMIASLLLRIAIEIASNWRKVAGKVGMDSRRYLEHLKKFYRWRKRIHFVITPICFGGYVIGLFQLFPYFKAEFSDGFYTYLIVSGIGSISVVAGIIIHQIRNELIFLKSLTNQKVTIS